MACDKSRSNRNAGRPITEALSLTLVLSVLVAWCFAPRPLTVQAGAQTSDQFVVAGAEWARSYNGPANCCERAAKIATDPRGNVYLTGQSTTVRDSPGGPFNDDITTIKYDPQGREVWARRFGGAGYSTDTPTDIAADALGNVYVAGYLAGDDAQFITLKYDTDGNLLWAREAGPPLFDYALALDVDGEGNVYVTGREAYRFGNYGPIYRFLTVKYDAGGNELWQRTFDTAQQKGAEPADVKADADGNVYVTGKAYVSAGEDDDNGFDVFTIKYDPSGAVLWVRQFSGDGPHYYKDDSASKLRVDAQGNAYVLGSTSRGPNQNDVLVLRYTPGGDLTQTVRSNHPDNELGADFAFDGEGNIYAVAFKLVRNSNNAYFVFDVVTYKFGPDGGVLWRNLYASSGGGNDFGRGVVLDGAGGVYVGVHAQQGTAFNDNYVLVKYLASDGTKEREDSFDGPAHDRDQLSGIAIDSAGNIYLTGDSQSEWESGRSVDFLTLKITSTVPPPAPTKPVRKPGLMPGPRPVQD